MTLSLAEKKFHDSVYRKISAEAKERLTHKTCIKLLQRGVPELETCEKVNLLNHKILIDIRFGMPA